jgi:iron complex outermembrane receptor protein
MQQALNTNRITIRGIGARTPFGTTRIKTYLDNIRLPMRRVNQVLKILI